ncbi:MAG: tRNA (adenosine(37)-N6)-dimethylallyltransferase MiaA [Polyangiales bacterium]
MSVPAVSTPVLVIAGPTATGKTDAAVELALRLGGEIISADSVQVYRGFDIGSAKPTDAERQGVPHHLLDVLDPHESWDAMDFARAADGVIADLTTRGKLAIVTGGTGLWLRALLRGLVDLPAVDAALRARLEDAVAERGAPSLHAELQRVDPTSAVRIHPNDALRIVRALEVFEQTGTPLGALRDAHALGAERYRTFFVVLDVDAEAHTERVTRRFDAMLERGLETEVRSLRRTVPEDAKPFGSVGYRQMLDFVEDRSDLATARTEAIRATRTYARRQRTWFRGEPGIHWRTDANTLLDADGTARVAAWLGVKP